MYFALKGHSERNYKKKQALVKWLGYRIPLSSLQELSN